MTIEEAIKHAEEVAKDKADLACTLWNSKEKARCEECAEEHRQLALWLEELKRYREALQKVIDEIKKEKEDAMFEPNSDFYDGVFYALGFTLGVIDKELGEVGGIDG